MDGSIDIFTGMSVGVYLPGYHQGGFILVDRAAGEQNSHLAPGMGYLPGVLFLPLVQHSTIAFSPLFRLPIVGHFASGSCRRAGAGPPLGRTSKCWSTTSLPPPIHPQGAPDIYGFT